MTQHSIPINVPFTDEELDELADFLDSTAVPEEAMDISMLHGFLTGLILAPKSLLIEKWLPEVWGENGATPTYTSATQQAHVESLIQRLHAQISAALAGDAKDFTPILYVDEEDQLDIARPWCFGFTQAIWLQEEEWAGLLEDDGFAALLDPIFDCADDEARAKIDTAGESLTAWEHEIAAAIPDLVAEIRLYQRDHG